MFADILNIDEDIQWNLERNCIWKYQKVSIVQSRKKIQTFLYSHLKKNHNFSHSLVRLGQEIAGFSLIFVCFVVWKESFSFDTKLFCHFIGNLHETSFDGSFYLLFDLHRVPKKTSNSFLLAESCELIEGSTAFLALNISVFLRVCAFLTPFIRCVRVFL